MSDAKSPAREWRFYINDMIGFAERILSYTESMDQEKFTSSELTYDAVLHNLELIGEAATRTPEGIHQDLSAHANGDLATNPDTFSEPESSSVPPLERIDF